MAASLSLLALANTQCTDENTVIQDSQDQRDESNWNELQHQVVSGMAHDNTLISVPLERPAFDCSEDTNVTNGNATVIIENRNDISSECTWPSTYVDAEISCCME